MNQNHQLKDLLNTGVSAERAREIVNFLDEHSPTLSGKKLWQCVCSDLFTATDPFTLQQVIYQWVYGDEQIQHPVWVPSDAARSKTHIGQLMAACQVESVEELNTWCMAHKTEFWQTVLDKIGFQFERKPTAIIEEPVSFTQPNWLPGARFNIAAQCFNAAADNTAIISQKAGELSSTSYAQLDRLSNRAANSMQTLGLNSGDVVAVTLPLSVEAVAMYLGVIKAGGVIASIAESYSAEQIKTRIEIVNAKFMLTQDQLLRKGKSIPLYQRICDADAPTTIVLTTGEPIPLRKGDHTWQDFLSDNETFKALACEPSDACNILFSSGTTGTPKAIPWTHTTPIKCASDAIWHMDVHRDDVLAWPTSLGWMMGPWLIFAGLLNQATIAIYDDAPTHRGFGEFIQNTGVTLLGVVPSIVKQWRASECMQGLDWSQLKAFASTAEASNPEDMFYLMMLAGCKPIIEYCGGTEIGGGYMTSTLVQDNIPSTFATPSLGLDLVLLDDQGLPSDEGEVALIGPSIGLSNTLLNRDHDEVYFNGMPSLDETPPLRRHGDYMQRLANGYYKALGRVDDTMKLSGIKVSSAEIEQCLMQLDPIQECAAISTTPPGGGPAELVTYVVLMPNETIDIKTLHPLLQQQLKTTLNPLFKIAKTFIIEKLPRTASNKIMRRTLRAGYERARLGPI